MNTGSWLNLQSIFRFLLGIAILVLLISIFEAKQWARLLYGNFYYLLAAGVTSFLANITGTLRWYYSLRAVYSAHQFRFIELLKIYLSGTILGFMFVGGGLSLVFQAIVLKKKENISLGKISLSLAIDRILDPFLSLIVLVPACLYFFNQITLKQFSMSLWALLIALLISLAFFRNSSKYIFDYLIQYFKNATNFLNKIKSIFYLSKATKHDVPKTTADLNPSQLSTNYLILLTLFRMLFFVLRIKFIAVAFGFHVPFGIIIIGLIFFQLSWLLSISPGGIGIAEWGWVGVLVKYGFEASDGVLLSISFRIFLIIYTILAYYFVYFLCKLPRRKSTENK